MFLHSLFGRLTSFWQSAPDRRGAARRQSVVGRLSLERLEQRALPSFMAPINCSMASDSVITADFNGDGRSDLASGTGVRLGNGDGTFQPPIQTFNFSFTSGPQSVAVGDFTGDGRIDLAIANGTISGVSILLGRGDGTFAAPIDRSLPNDRPGISVTTGDLNGDGKLDLAVGSQNFSGDITLGYPAYLDILLGNGDGTFATAISHLLPNVGDYYELATTVQLGDLNGDGKTDVVAGRSFNNTLNVLLGNGDGSLGPVATYSTGLSPAVLWSQSMAIGDLNSDGHLDLVAADAMGTTVRVLPGNGTGTFLTYIAYTVGSHPESVVLTDLNVDGRTDVVTANSDSGNVSVLLGKGDFTFQPVRNFPAGVSTYSLAVGNFNGDAFPDVAVTDGEGPGSVLLNDGNWTTFGPPSIRISDVTAVEGHKGTTYLYFYVTLSVSSDVPVTVNYSTANGTAKASDGDYTAASGTLTFAPGETTKLVAVAVKGDRKKEANETFFVNLSGAVNAWLFDPQGVGTILNDD